MAFTVEPGIYIAPDRSEIELPLLEYDLDQWTERRVTMGTAAAKRLEEEAKEAAERVSHTIPEALLGIGVRIEDDVVITEDGHENLTRHVPKDPDEVEALCAETSWLTRT